MKPITFAELKRIQKLSLNEFNRWITALCKEIYEDGLREGESEFDDAAILTADRLMDIMLSVKGIGRNRAEQVLEAILSEGASDGVKT